MRKAYREQITEAIIRNAIIAKEAIIREAIIAKLDIDSIHRDPTGTDRAYFNELLRTKTPILDIGLRVSLFRGTRHEEARKIARGDYADVGVYWTIDYKEAVRYAGRSGYVLRVDTEIRSIRRYKAPTEVMIPANEVCRGSRVRFYRVIRVIGGSRISFVFPFPRWLVRL